MLLLGPRDFRQLTHVFDRGLAKFFPDRRQQPMPHAIPKKGNIPIRRILTPALALLAQKFLQCSAAKAKQRPYQLAKRASLLLKDDPWMNARQPSNAGTAKNAQQHRLRLIVERVRRCNLRNPTLPRQLAKKTVAQFTRRRLDAENLVPVNRRLANMQFEPVLPRQLRDKPLVLVRLFSAQLVIDMRHRQHNSQLGPQLQQQAKQSHGIRPT